MMVFYDTVSHPSHSYENDKIKLFQTSNQTPKFSMVFDFYLTSSIYLSYACSIRNKCFQGWALGLFRCMPLRTTRRATLNEEGIGQNW